MNVALAAMIVILCHMLVGFIIKIILIYKGKPTSKSVPSKLIALFAIILRGFVRELKMVMKDMDDPKERLRALINVILVILFIIAPIVGAIILLVYAPFGGQLCVVCAFGLLVFGILAATFVADLSIHEVL